MGSILLFLLVVVIAYLCGSICSAILVSRFFALPDPRTGGSLNPGATNVLRLAGKKYAAIVLVADMLKGFFPVLLAKLLGAGPATLGFTCLAAVLGHMYPVFFNFKGGKGVATALGALLGLQFLMGVVLIAIWLLVVNFTRYSSLASIISLTFAPLFAIVSMRNLDIFPPLIIITFFILYKHRENINRLIDGEEPKLQLRHHQFADVADEIIEEADTLRPVETKPTKKSPPKKAASNKTESKPAKTEVKKKPEAKKSTEKKAEPKKKAEQKPRATKKKAEEKPTKK